MAKQSTVQFEELPQQWLPATFSQKVQGSRPVAVTLASVPLVVFRASDGQVGALVDRCPHRGVRLSDGQVGPHGLRCPFHGWSFGSDGGCAHVPLNPGARRDLLGATAFPVVERGGLIWVWTGDPALGAPPDLPALPEALEAPGWSRRELSQPWDAHWTRAMENMLDIPHLPYVHAATIGGALRRKPDLDQMGLDIQIHDQPYGFDLTWAFGADADNSRVEWRRPCGMVLALHTPVGELRQHIFCVPAAPGQTTMLLVSAARRPWWARLLPVTLFHGFEDRILREDQHVVETSPPGSVLDPAVASAERSVATDKPTLRFRAWLRSLPPPSPSPSPSSAERTAPLPAAQVP